MYVYMCVHVCMYVCVHVYVYIYACICVHVYIYVCVCVLLSEPFWSLPSCSHCDGVSLTCEACREPGGPPPTEGPVTPTTPYVEDIPEPPLHDFFCSKLLDLVFLLDGSSKLSEADFETLKAFVVGMMERLHISQKRIRVAVVEYHDGSHAYLALQDRKRPSELRRIAGQVKYAGSEVASTSEVLKYTLFQIFGRIDRPEASRVALLLTASQEPPRLARNLVRYVQGLKKKKVSVVPVGIGPHASLKQIRLIEKQASENKAFVLSGVHELEQRMDEIVSYLCDLALEVSAPTLTQRPLTAQVTVAPQLLGPSPPGPKRSSVVLDVAFLLEGSDEVGEANFNRSAEFVEEVIRRMDVGRDGIHVTVLQYSYVVTVEHSFREPQSKDVVLQRLREVRYRGGNQTNTGLALQYLSEHSFSASQGDREQAPNLVYMVTGSPASDKIQRMPGDIQLVPIGVGPRVDVQELERVSWPQTPIFIQDFERLPREAPDLVLQRCCSEDGPHLPTLAPAPGMWGLGVGARTWGARGCLGEDAVLRLQSVFLLCVFCHVLPSGRGICGLLRGKDLFLWASAVAQTVKILQKPDSITGLGRSLEKGHGHPLQYSCLENPLSRDAWQATVIGLQRVRQN